MIMSQEGGVVKSERPDVKAENDMDQQIVYSHRYPRLGDEAVYTSRVFAFPCVVEAINAGKHSTNAILPIGRLVPRGCNNLGRLMTRTTSRIYGLVQVSYDPP